MSVSESDILQKIPFEDWPKLAEFYGKYKESAPHVFSFIHMAIRWEKTEKFKNSIKILSPTPVSWPVDGTFIAVLNIDGTKAPNLNVRQLFVYTIDENCMNLYKCLTQTQLIDFKNIEISCIDQKHIPIITKVCEFRQVKVRQSSVPYFMYSLKEEQALKLDVHYVKSILVKQLDASHVQKINDLWRYKCENSYDFLKFLMEANGGFGVFLEKTDELVAWGMLHRFNHIGMVQTDDNHLKKGYGSLIVKVLARNIARNGFSPFATISADNLSSIRMFEKLGFRKIGVCAYFNL